MVARARLLILLTLIAAAVAPEARGQSRRRRDAAAAAAAPAVVPDGAALPPGANGPQPGDDKADKDKADKGKDKDSAKPGEGKPGDTEKKDEGPKPLQRPTTPAKPPDRNELKVRPDKTGKVKFNFTGQNWPDVLQWLADISGMSLDWQEVPGDYLNLTTQRSYAVEEVRDLINRHLLARGYTLLRLGEVLSVVSLKKLDPAMVPRVSPAELDRRDPHEFVRVSFTLSWIMAEQAAEELKPMLSPYGKLTPLPATNRLEALDAVVNLCGVRALLTEEQSSDGQERLVREFRLEHARAADVLEQLQTLLGIEPKAAGKKPGGGGGEGGDPMQQRIQEMQQQVQQQMQQAMQQGGPGGPGGKAPAGAKPKAEVHLVVNLRRNSVLAQAPADKMAIIQQAVKALDVDTDGPTSLLAGVTRTQIYRLASIDPEPLVKTLEEIGNLDPRTRLQIDRPNRAIIAYAPLADQVTIRALVEKLDGTGRKFEVVQLRRLAADYVAGSVAFMMTGAKEKPQQRRPFWFDSGPTISEPQEKPNEFRCDADVEHNRLLLWANDVEVTEVKKLLEKLGEIPPEGGSSNTVRTLDVPAGKETDEWLSRVQRVWPSLAPNPLAVPPQEPAAAHPAHAAPEKAPTRPAAADAKQTDAREPPAGQRTAAAGPPTALAIWTVAATDESSAQAEPAQAELAKPQPAPVPAVASAVTASPVPGAAPPPAAPPAPIQITRSPDGRLIIASPDTKALDQLEELMAQLEPPARTDYKIYRLKYAWATGLATTLRDFFQEGEKEKRPRSPWFWDFDSPQQTETKSPVRLSHRRPLKIISDSESNSILVQGGEASQLKKIDELIDFYDKPQPADARSLRKTQTIALKFSKAKAVAEAVKDVYRDLLSANDKALQANEKRPERQVTYIFDAADTGADQKTPTFKGLLSLGVDDVSNSLVVSAPVFLFEDVSRLIEELDKAAQPSFTKVEVAKLGRGSSPAQVQEAIARVFGGNASVRTSKPLKPPTLSAKPAAGQHQHGHEESGSKNGP